MTAPVKIATNEYWEAVREHVNPTGSLWGTPEVGGIRDIRDYGGDWERWHRETPQRRELVNRYSWTITDPATVAFVVEHSAGRMVDPMAGSGWWAHVLAPFGVDVVCYDASPGDSTWHKGITLWVPITAAPAVESVPQHADRTLFLAWPPYDSPAGFDALSAYAGSRVIFTHEGDGGCIGDDQLFELLAAEWTEVASHTPVQWFGLHDRIDVYERATSGEAGERSDTPNPSDLGGTR